MHNLKYACFSGGVLLKTRFLNNVFLSAIIIAVALMAYLYVVVHPAYRELLIENAEDEAVRFSSFLITSQQLDQPLSQKNIPVEITDEVGRLHGDEMLIKLRIFSPEGVIIYSTLPKEMGSVNDHEYFHNFVATGNVYSKTVKKNAMTAEMEIVTKDLVETYVPIMTGARFNGAIETYYDITESSQKINNLTQHSLALLGSLSLILLSLLYYALYHADLSIVARKKAENDLRLANDKLEQRVAERAGELIKVNESLSREIAERSLAQLALSEALSEMRDDKEKISGILRSVDDGLLVVDSSNQIVLMNTPAEKILAIPQKEALGKDLFRVIENADLNETFTRLLSHEALSSHNSEFPFSDAGQELIYHARTSHLRDEDETIHGTVILMQNVTQERKLESMKAEFLAMAAHELSTPLATIIGYADLLAGEHAPDLTPEIQNESLAFIHDKANALSRIVDDLLDISRAESGQQLSINKVSFDLCQNLESMVKNYDEMHTGHSILLEGCALDSDVYADPVRIGQVLDNIMSNAVKYTPPGGQILVDCKIENNSFRVEISDNGIGMSAGQLEHVFNKFYRADASDTAKPGIGLGMSITRLIIEGHNGTISIQSEPDQGTKVIFYLPRITPHKD